MGLYVYRCAAEQDEERHEAPEKPAVARFPDKNHCDSTHAYMAARESRRRALAHFLRTGNEVAEDSVRRQTQGLEMSLEVVAQLRKMAGKRIVDADGLEIVLRTGNRQKSNIR